MNNYVYGRSQEQARLDYLRRKNYAIIGGRFRGSKISKGWIKRIGFNPKIDVWWLDPITKIIHFEQIKSARRYHKARISKDEIEAVRRFAKIFSYCGTIWVGYVTKEWRKPWRETKLN